MPKADHISDLERRQKVLEDEIEKALHRHRGDDLMIVDLKRRMLHIRHEIERLRHAMSEDRRLH
jgi:hypothetical protein